MNSTSGPQSGRQFLWIALLAVTLLKLGLVGKGLFAFEDEGRYTDAARALEHFARGRIPAGLEEVFSTQGRPGATFIQTVPNALQFLTSRFHGLHIYNPANTYPLFLFNFGAYLLLLWVLYRYAVLLLRSREAALMAVLLYSSLINPQLYLRHALPYDAGLLVLLFVLEQCTRRAVEGAWRPMPFVLLGMAACFGCAIYPGYYPVFLTAGVVLLVANWRKEHWRARVACKVAYAVGGFGCFGLLEFLSRAGGRSFIRELSTLSGQITQGAFDEMLTYGLSYQIEVERWGGVLVLVGVAACFWQCAKVIGRGEWEREGRVLLPLGLAAGGFVAYSVAGYLLHSMVLYGRLLHQYYPFACIGIAYAFDGILLRSAWGARWIKVGVVTCAVVFLANWASLMRLSYPADVSAWTADRYQFPEVLNVCEFESSFSLVVKPDLFLPPPPGAPKANGIRAVLVNPCVYTPVHQSLGHTPFRPGERDRLILDLPHFLGHPAYQFEGYLPAEREMIRKADPRIRFYERDP